jgi:hypothetical protein
MNEYEKIEQEKLFAQQVEMFQNKLWQLSLITAGAGTYFGVIDRGMFSVVIQGD